jgi:hypothetical protein
VVYLTVRVPLSLLVFVVDPEVPVYTTFTVQEVAPPPPKVMPVVAVQAVPAVSSTREYADGAAAKLKVTDVDDVLVRVTVCGGPALAPTSVRLSELGDTVGRYPVPLRATDDGVTVTAWVPPLAVAVISKFPLKEVAAFGLNATSSSQELPVPEEQVPIATENPEGTVN